MTSRERAWNMNSIRKQVRCKANLRRIISKKMKTWRKSKTRKRRGHNSRKICQKINKKVKIKMTRWKMRTFRRPNNHSQRLPPKQEKRSRKTRGIKTNQNFRKKRSNRRRGTSSTITKNTLKGLRSCPLLRTHPTEWMLTGQLLTSVFVFQTIRSLTTLMRKL